VINCEFENGNKAHLRHVVSDTLVLKGGKVLLSKRSSHLSEAGKWSLSGGFMEHDETIKQAAIREIREETGWEVKDLTLLTIIDTPNRPNEDRQNVDFIFFAQAVKKVGEPDDESTEQKWFDLDDLPSDDEIAFDHADSIKIYKKWLKDKTPLPIFG
jgi:8-oxo-dGTP diphosphatase